MGRYAQKRLHIFGEDIMSLTLTNYWWLLIWLFIGGPMLNGMPKRRELLGDRVVERWDMFPAVMLVVPFILWAGFRSDSFGDTGAYRISFLNAEASVGAALRILASDSKDVGYYALQSVVKIIIGNRDKLFFTMVAAFQMLSVVQIYRKFTPHYWLCIFLFVASTDYLSWMHNGLRQFTAVTMILAALPWVIEKRYASMIALILLASTIHGSAILMIPIIFIIQGEAWNAKTLLLLCATGVVVIFVDRFSPILNNLLQDTQYDNMMTNEIWTQDDGANIFRVLVYSVPALFSLAGLRYVRMANDPVINICVNCSIVTMALYLFAAVSSGIYIGRLPIYTTLQGYMVLPWLIDRIFERKSARLITMIMIAMFCMFFFFQMHFVWGLI